MGVAVGKKGVGKTFQTDALIQAYVNGNPRRGVNPRKVLILDVNDEYTDYKAIHPKHLIRFSVSPKIECRRIRPYNYETGKKLTMADIQTILFSAVQNFRGGMLLIEDINKYISDSLPNDLIGAICTNRHIDLDIIMHFQSIGRITTKIWQNVNWIRFHKNTDSVDIHRKKFEDKYTYLKIAENLVNARYYNGDIRFFVYVNIDEEKIDGNYDQEEIDAAIDEFISQNYRKLVQPLLTQKNSKGQKAYTPETAIAKVKTQIYMSHIN